MNLASELRDALSEEMVPKFLATRDPAGKPNIVPITTITPYDEETLVFGEFMMNKSKANLLECPHVGISVMKRGAGRAAFETWEMQGTFLGFESRGKAVDTINASRLFRYNAYTSIRAAGLIRVESVSPRRVLTKPGLLWGFGWASACARMGMARRTPRVMPPRVIEKFSRLVAIRALGHMGSDGMPRACSVMACVAAGSNRLVLSDTLFQVHKPEIADGTAVAVCVITMEPIAYQVKGIYRGSRLGVGLVEVEECYSASPPLLGERLDTIECCSGRP